MFVLMSLIHLCLRCVFAPLLGMNRQNQPLAPVKRAQTAINLIALSQTHPLAPIHALNARLTV
jgi:hypothetical protein